MATTAMHAQQGPGRGATGGKPTTGVPAMIALGVVFLILFLVIAANLPENMISRFGFDPGILKATLAAVAITGMIARHHIALVVLVLVVAAGANLPDATALTMGIDRDYLTATLAGLILTPFMARHL